MIEKIGAAQIAAIVVNYRTAELTIACVESLLRTTGVGLRIIVVDNHSDDGSADQLRARFAGKTEVQIPGRARDDSEGRVTIVARDVNDGYAGGNNAGVEIARQLGARFVFILNSDTTVASDCVEHLVAEAKSGARPALVAPRILVGDTDIVWFAGARFSLWTGRPAHMGLGRPTIGATPTTDIPFASGCALLVDLDVVGAGPLFDETLFSYAEDLDLSLRVREKGRRIRYVPAAVVRHFEGASHRKAGGQALRFYLNTRNVLRVVARHARWYHWITLGPMLAVDVVGRFCAVAVRDRDPAAFRAVLLGAWHAVSGGRHPIEPRTLEQQPATQ